MGESLLWRRGAAIILGAGLIASAASPAIAAAQASPVRSAAAREAGPNSGIRVQCVAISHVNDKKAIAMARAIDARLRYRASVVGLYETDTRTGITCQWHAAWHFWAASAIKVTILSALLVKLEAEHKQMTDAQKGLAWLMITQSDNSAANILLYQVGYENMQRFLNLAGMSQTVLSPYWGLTLITPHDEARLLTLLSTPNRLLTMANRIYVRYLMAHVVAWQRWGVTAGAPRSVTAHIKNGWLPWPPPRYTWEINSLGIFTSPHRVYLIVILTRRNPSMTYGVDTIQGAAMAIQGALNPRAADLTPPMAPQLTWGTPDETIPGWVRAGTGQLGAARRSGR